MTAVKYFTNVMQGAPQLSNNWGCMVDLLDACLVNGFNLKPITSITSADGVATVTIDGGLLRPSTSEDQPLCFVPGLFKVFAVPRPNVLRD